MLSRFPGAKESFLQERRLRPGEWEFRGNCHPRKAQKGKTELKNITFFSREPKVLELGTP